MTSQSQTKPRMLPLMALPIGALALLIALLVTLWNVQPPAPAALDAPANQFSALRAHQTLTRMFGPGAEPHPLGSPAQLEVRRRILDELNTLGAETQTQTAWQCLDVDAGSLTCAHVTNILARLPGDDSRAGPGRTLAIVSHYDSVPAGPGAADAGSGIATILELGRAWQSSGPGQPPLLLILTDGEELGLIGARALHSHAWFGDIGAVLNLEARGNRGLPVMFETSADNQWLIAAYQAAVARPVASSLAYAAYELLPSDTDLTVFKEAGLPGMNFALIGNAQSYHLPVDDLQSLDLGGLQVEGETLLALARHMAGSLPPPDQRPVGAAAYLSLPLWGLVWVEQSVQVVYALLFPLLLLAVVYELWLRRGVMRLAELGWGLLAVLAALAGAMLAGWALPALMRLLTGAEMPWWGSPLPARWAVGLGVLLANALAGRLFARRAGAWGMALGAWLLWNALGLLLALWQPATALVLVLPGALAAVLLYAAMRFGNDATGPLLIGALSVAALVAGLVLFDHSLMFEAALGYDMGVMGLAFGLALVGLLPFWAVDGLDVAAPAAYGLRRLGQPFPAVLAVLALGIVAALVASVVMPVFTPARPQPLSLTYYEDLARGQAFWIARSSLSNMPADMRTALPFENESIYAWTDFARPVVRRERDERVQLSGAPGPGLEVLSDQTVGTERTLTLRLRSPRQAGALDVYIPAAALRALSFEGQAFELGTLKEAGQFFVLACSGQACDGAEVRLVLNTSAPHKLLLVDRSYSLPANAAALLAARPPTAVPADLGDLWLVLTEVDL